MPASRAMRVAVACGVVALACNEGRQDASEKNAEYVQMEAPQSAPAPPAADGFAVGGGTAAARVPGGHPGSHTESDMRGDGSGELRGVDLSAQGSPTRPGSLPVDAAAPMLIRTGSATIEVDSLETAIARLRLIASQLGGFVGNTSIQGGREEVRSATVEIRVPAQRWSQLLQGLEPIGRIESQVESAQDVGEEYTDVSARVSNARRLEDRLVALLASRTGKLEEVLAVERELARIREEIERYEGRLRYLRSRTAVSTMTVMLHEPAPVLGSRPGSSPIADAFRAAWRNFVGLVAGLISMMGILIPLALLGWLGWLVFRWARGGGRKGEG